MPGVIEPELLELLDLSGLAAGDILGLGAVGLEVVELPLVELELAPARERWVERAGEPAVVVDRTLAEHRVELRAPCPAASGR